MANPLARVVMNSIAQKSGKVEERNSSTKSTNSTNLGKRETQILTSLLNNSVKTSSNSYNKSDYGRSKSANKSKTMQTLSSLAGNKPISTNSDIKNTDSVGNISRQNLKSLCTLGDISNGKVSNNSTNVNTNRVSSKSTLQTLSLGELVNGDKKPAGQTVQRSKQTGGMTTLGDFAKSKTKQSQDNESSDRNKDAGNTNSYVRSNVINNLEAYIPKVTLESIGKKGSLF